MFELFATTYKFKMYLFLLIESMLNVIVTLIIPLLAICNIISSRQKLKTNLGSNIIFITKINMTEILDNNSSYLRTLKVQEDYVTLLQEQ